LLWIVLAPGFLHEISKVKVLAERLRSSIV
jgi:hypothetical protein